MSENREILELKAAAKLELLRRQQSRKTVYGIVRATGEYGGELLYALQEQEGVYVHVDIPPDVFIPEKMERVLTTQKRFKLLFGGRGSGKSVSISSILAGHAKDYKLKTLCLREWQNSIEDSVHALLVDRIETHKWVGFNITDKSIAFGDDDLFKYRGMARNPTAVKSMFGFFRGWVEEAQDLSTDSIELLTPTIREEGSEIWFSMNPQSSADPISKRFLAPFYNHLLDSGFYEDDLHLIVWVNYTDNPWHRELESERAFDEQNMSTTAYRHKWLGHYNDEVENSIIKADWFNAAIDAHTKLGFKGEGALIAAYDPSDMGPDDKGYALRHGSVVLDVQSGRIGDSNEGTDWALNLAIQQQADVFVWDCDGMGVALKRQVDQALKGKRIRYEMFRGSHAPDDPATYYSDVKSYGNTPKTNKDTFANKRAQYYTRLADRFYNTYRAVVLGEYVNPDDMISLSSEITNMEQLRSEVCRIPRKSNPNGKVQIVSKVDLQKKPYQMASPNLADALMMTMIHGVSDEVVTINFAGWG